MYEDKFPKSFINDINGWNFSQEELTKNKGKILTLDIDFGNVCSLNCPHCFRKDNKVDFGKGKPMSYDKITKLIRDAKKLGLKSVKFLGAGEPFENKKFIEFLRFLKSLDIIPLIFTKGHVIGDDKLAKLWNSDYGITNSKKLIEEFKRSETTVVFPTDTIVATEISDSAKTEVVSIEAVPDGSIGLDIGPESVRLFKKALKDARTIIWNGPMGVFEYKPFETGTFEIARELAELTASGTKTIVSGGDTGAVIARLSLEHKFTHISTGGGATLEFLEGKNLPGVEVLTDKPRVQAV